MAAANGQTLTQVSDFAGGGTRLGSHAGTRAMSEQAARPAGLAGARLLVVEDQFLLAEDIVETLTEQGAIVVGPVGQLGAALALAASEQLDAAILDVDLGGHSSSPVAEVLERRGVPYVLATAYDIAQLPRTLQTAPRLSKPYVRRELLASVAELIG